MPPPERTLVVWCADWPVVVHDVDPGTPAAVVQANRVVAANAAARSEGVQRGQRRRQAEGCASSLVILERDRSREARRFEPVAATIERSAPRLEITRPGWCSVPTRGPSRYFGGDHALASRLHEAVCEVLDEVLAGSTAVRVGVADGPFAAGLAARSAPPDGIRVVSPGHTPDFLAAQPVTVLEQPALTGVLVRLGVTTLGAFAALEPADVAGRFGTGGLRAHRLASGVEDRLLDAHHPAPELAVSRELDPPVDRIEQVAFVARDLAEELAADLGGRGMACARVLVEVETEHGERLARTWRAEEALGAGAIADRVRWQLDAWLRAPAAGTPTGALTRLVLVPEATMPATGRQLGFWGGASETDERAAGGLARVQALLGAEAVRVPERCGGRGPGDRFGLVPAATVELVGRRVAATAEPPWPGSVPAPSPAVVHPDPIPVELHDPAGAPVAVDGRGMLSAPPAALTDRCTAQSARSARPVGISAWAGPWPAQERWWDPAGHRRVARLQVLTEGGDAHLLALEGGRWWIEATYD